MWRRASLGRSFGWLWAAYAVSAYGTGLGFGAFSVIAIKVLNASSAGVAALSASGLAIGALLAVPLGPWMEFRAKRPVMIAMDVVRFVALASIPLAYCLGRLSFAQLLVVSVVATAAKIAFTAAGGAYLKTIVPADGLLLATSRFESTTWSATVIGPPLGGAAIGLLGPVTTVVVDAASYLLSALGTVGIREPEQSPKPRKTPMRRWSDIVEGWRYILTHHTLRRFFFNVMLVNGLIMATEPLLSVLMLTTLRFPVWEYGLAFAVPCIGGLIGSRLARRVAARCGERTVLRVFGTLRACWPLGLVFIRPGLAGLVIVMAAELGLIICASIFNPVFAAYRLNNTDDSRHARVLTAWSISTSTSIAVVTVLWGLLAQLTSPRAAIALAGVLLLGTPFLLPRHPGGPRRKPPGPRMLGDTMTTRAVIFDLDGVLVDSEQTWDEVRRAVTAAHGGRWTPDATRAMQGMSTPEWAGYLVERLGAELSPDRIAEMVIDEMVRRYAARPPILPHAEATVRAIAERAPVAIASSSPPVLIDAFLAATDLTGLVPVAVSSEQVPAGKPAPDVYLEAARRLGVPAESCVAVEDSTNGLRAALAAGMTVFAVPNPHFPPDPDVLAQVDVVLDEISALPGALATR